MAVKLRVRRDTAANWTAANPTLDNGEIGYETDTAKMKVGDGSTAWNSLTYFSGGGAVSSVFGRSGAVVAASGDYDAGQIDNDSTVIGATVADALSQLNTDKIDAADVPVDSVFGRTGAVAAQASDYDASQIDNDSGVVGATVADALDTLDAAGGGGDSTVGLTKEVYAVENISEGDLVSIVGSAGAYSTVEVADKDTHDNVAGIATEDIANGTTGAIQVGGTIQEGFINTSGLTAGDPLWLGSAGAVTDSVPSSGAIIRVGTVGVVAPSSGSLILDLPAFEADAAEAAYDNTSSGLTATNVKDALDELAPGIIDKSADFTLSAAEANKTVRVTGNVEITIPTGLGDAYQTNILNVGSGVVTFALAVGVSSLPATPPELDNTGDAEITAAWLQHSGSDTVDILAGTAERITFGVALSDETTDLATGTAVFTWHMPHAMVVESVRIEVNEAPTGSGITVDINEAGTSVLSTKATIDATEETSATAATPPVLSDNAWADAAKMTVDIDAVGSTTPGKGLKLWVYGYAV